MITDFRAKVLPLRIIFRQFVESAKPDGMDSSRRNIRQSQQDFRFPLSLYKYTPIVMALLDPIGWHGQ